MTTPPRCSRRPPRPDGTGSHQPPQARNPPAPAGFFLSSPVQPRALTRSRGGLPDWGAGIQTGGQPGHAAKIQRATDLTPPLLQASRTPTVWRQTSWSVLMPNVPVIHSITKSEQNDFMIFHWSWGDQSNLTIQSKGIANPENIRHPNGLPQTWPSYNGEAISPERIAEYINSLPYHNIYITNVEILINNSGYRLLSGISGSYIDKVNDLLGGRYNFIGYTRIGSVMPQNLVDALAGLPDGYLAPEHLNALAETPGFGTFEATNSSHIARLERGRRLPGRKMSRLQPYHVRAGKHPDRPADVAGSMPRAAGSAAGGRIGGSPARGLTQEIEEIIDVVN